MTEYTHAFIKIEDCGCILGTQVDTTGFVEEESPSNLKVITARLQEALGNSYNNIERLPIEEARERFGTKCEEHK